MMARISSVGPEAFSRSDRISNGLISNGLSSVVRDHMAMGTSRRDRLFGVGSQTPPSVFDASDVNELKEEDVWGGTDSKSYTEDAYDFRGVDGSPYGYGKDVVTDGDPYRFLNNGRRWLGLEKETGLSVAYGDGGRSRGLHSFSPLNRGSANVPNQSRESGTPGRTSSRLIPQRETKVSSHYSQSSSAMDNGRQIYQSSAPVNVPDWSKILGSERKPREYVDDMVDGDDDDEDDERLPPHELIAKEYAKSQITTFSMCEGTGRTLKGRDLSRVRNTVLMKTGFIDQ